MLTGLFFAVSGYLLGSILFASIISKLFHKDIISKSPDKNYGTANAFRYGGVLCDAALRYGKGLFACVYLYAHGKSFGGHATYRACCARDRTYTADILEV